MKVTQFKSQQKCSTVLIKGGLLALCLQSAQAMALDTNQHSDHMAENAPANARSFMDIGNLTDKKIYIWDIFYQLEGEAQHEFSNTLGDPIELSPGEWSRDCDVFLDGCFYKGASFTNIGWTWTYTWTNNHPITNHSWWVVYACEGESSNRTMKMTKDDSSYWHEAVIVDCNDDDTNYSAIGRDGDAMDGFLEKSPYAIVTDTHIISDFINEDTPFATDKTDSESWDNNYYEHDRQKHMPIMEGVNPVLMVCQNEAGQTARELGLKLNKNSLAEGCECRDEDQDAGESCPDLGVVYYWELPSTLVGNIDATEDVRVGSLYKHKLRQIYAGDISGGADLKEGTLLSVNVTTGNDGLDGVVDHVVTAGRQNKYTYTADIAYALNSQTTVPVYGGERQADGSLQVRGSQYRNWIWGEKSDYSASINRIDPANIDNINGPTLAKGNLVEVSIEQRYGERYRFRYIVPSDHHGANWRWPAAIGNLINSEAIENNLPVRVGEYASDGTVSTIGSSYRNRVWVATEQPSQWTVKITIH